MSVPCRKNSSSVFNKTIKSFSHPGRCLKKVESGEIRSWHCFVLSEDSHVCGMLSLALLPVLGFSACLRIACKTEIAYSTIKGRDGFSGLIVHRLTDLGSSGQD